MNGEGKQSSDSKLLRESYQGEIDCLPLLIRIVSLQPVGYELEENLLSHLEA